jgi:ribonuclease-3
LTPPLAKKRRRPAPPLSGLDATHLAQAETLLGHRFTRPDLLREALTHRSANAGLGSNERLEFVGDRVLGLLVAEWLVERFPSENEGALGKRLAHLVSQPVLAEIAEALGLPALLDVATPEARAGVRRRATVLADAIEASIGALFLDAGLDPARAFVRRAWQGIIQSQLRPPQDAKSALQEWAHARGLPSPAYKVVSATGPSHAPLFVIAVTVAGTTASASATSKKAGEQSAAEALLGMLKS